MTLAQEHVAYPTMTRPVRNETSLLVRGWTFLTRLGVMIRGSRHPEDDIFKRYETCRWCDSTERQLHNELMFGRSTRF